MASLNLLVERARRARQEALVVRREMALLTERSASERRRLAERRHVVDASVARAAEVRDRLPTWPAWGPPDTADLRLTLVRID